MSMTDTTPAPESADVRLSELTTVIVVLGVGKPGALRSVSRRIRTEDVPALMAALDELDVE